MEITHLIRNWKTNSFRSRKTILKALRSWYWSKPRMFFIAKKVFTFLWCYYVHQSIIVVDVGVCRVRYVGDRLYLHSTALEMCELRYSPKSYETPFEKYVPTSYSDIFLQITIISMYGYREMKNKNYATQCVCVL